MSAPPGPEKRSGRFRVAADFLMGVGVTALSLLLLEGILALAGVEPQPLDTNRGFDEGEQYIYPDPETPGGHRMSLGIPQDRHPIPPKGGARRVLLFGGSNTRGLSTDYLELVLENEVDQPYEVINLGRSGYGSQRVALLVEQAMEQLQPDVVVIYCGHNEFVEWSFALDLEEAWSSPFGRGGVQPPAHPPGLAVGLGRQVEDLPFLVRLEAVAAEHESRPGKSIPVR